MCITNVTKLSFQTCFTTINVTTATCSHQVDPLPPRMHWVVDRARSNSSLISFAFRLTCRGCLQQAGNKHTHVQSCSQTYTCTVV